MKVFQIAGAGILMLALPVLCAAAGTEDGLSPQDTQPGAGQTQPASGDSMGLGKASPGTLSKHRSLSGNTGSTHEDPLQLHFKNADGGYDTYDLETGTWAPGSSEYDDGSGSGDMGDSNLNDPLNPGK